MANWICIIDGVEVGPMSPAQLKGLVSTGKVLPETLLKKTDMDRFVKAGSVNDDNGTISVVDKKLILSYALQNPSEQD